MRKARSSRETEPCRDTGGSEKVLYVLQLHVRVVSDSCRQICQQLVGMPAARTPGWEPSAALAMVQKRPSPARCVPHSALARIQASPNNAPGGARHGRRQATKGPRLHTSAQPTGPFARCRCNRSTHDLVKRRPPPPAWLHTCTHAGGGRKCCNTLLTQQQAAGAAIPRALAAARRHPAPSVLRPAAGLTWAAAGPARRPALPVRLLASKAATARVKSRNRHTAGAAVRLCVAGAAAPPPPPRPRDACAARRGACAAAAQLLRGSDGARAAAGEAARSQGWAAPTPPVATTPIAAEARASSAPTLPPPAQPTAAATASAPVPATACQSPTLRAPP
mmetsp:Transcript_18653/g.55643  ORF Transcript_18653/g.55643 Transcript_18653/m.55643 type:complete len:335 (-) Transcript_18653:392-1396(-)